MNQQHQNQSNLHSNDDYNNHEEIIGQYVMELPVFGNKKHNITPNQQRKKKVLKPIRQHTLSANRRRQCTSITPYQTTYTSYNRNHSNTSNVNNLLFDDHILRIKQLENALVEARMKTRELMAENRLLKTMEKRHESALSVYEGKQAKLPQIIKSYDEEIRTLQTRIRQMKISYKEMENRYKSQSNELIIIKKQYKHLLDLSRNKHLSKREKLSDQLDEAQIIMKERDNKIQNLMKQLELQNKTNRHHISLENVKVKELQQEVKRLKSENQNLGLNLDKIKTKSYGVRQNFAKGITEESISITPRLVNVPTIHGRGDKIEESLNNTVESISLKPVSFNGENGDNYSINNFTETPSRQQNSNTIIKSNSTQINDKPYSSNISNSLAWQNRVNLSKLTKEIKPELNNVISNEFEDGNEQIASDSSSVQNISMSRKQKDLLIEKLNQVSEDQDNNYGSYYQSKLLKQFSDKRYPSLDSNDESDDLTNSD